MNNNRDIAVYRLGRICILRLSSVLPGLILAVYGYLLDLVAVRDVKRYLARLLTLRYALSGRSRGRALNRIALIVHDRGRDVVLVLILRVESQVIADEVNVARGQDLTRLINPAVEILERRRIGNLAFKYRSHILNDI